MREPTREDFWHRLVGTLLDHRLVVLVLTALMVLGGLAVAPFRDLPSLFPRSPLAVDALPDLGENQQLVFTEWPGRSPRDVEDQLTFPLTAALLGVPGVRTIRSNSELGFSTLYLIFEDDVEFYWARSRVLEKLASLPPGTVPEGVSPALGPDATGLGQVFWYTLEGQDPQGRTVGGWDPDELRSLQDWTLRYALQSVPGVSEVASIGGYVREYQVDVNPEAMRAHRVTLPEVADAVRKANLDVGARTLEVNGVEYLVRGLGFLKDLEDLEQTVVVARGNTPVRIEDLGTVTWGPALRRGALDDEGAPAVGGVVVARYRANPQEVIERVKARIAQVQPGLPSRVLEDGTVSKVTVVPFYDRSTLIDETLGTLSTALLQQLVITVLVVVVLLRNLRASLVIAATLPLGVLATFLAMKGLGVDANLMALGGIAIAIGTMVDIGIVFVENIDRALAEEPGDPTAAVRSAAAEVAPAVLTSLLTTLLSFLPVFGLTDAELRLFAPLAATKTLAMGLAWVLALALLPVIGLLLARRPRLGLSQRWAALPQGLTVAFGTWALAVSWMPLGADRGTLRNVVFTAGLLGLSLGAFRLFERAYPSAIRWVLANQATFLLLPAGVVLWGALAWLGVGRLIAPWPTFVQESAPAQALKESFPGFGREYLPPFDEGSFLYMPTAMPHGSVGEVQELLSQMDAAIAAIPEVDRVVGKLGRVESALDPAPVTMIETVITYLPEYGVGPDGERVRQWRDHIRSPRDLWAEITQAAEIPGMTGAPWLMPIQARLVMLQSGMRAPLGVKVKGPDLASLDAFGNALEQALKEVPGVRPETVFADRVVGKPYLELALDREALGRLGASIQEVQEVLEVALGGIPLTRTVEGRERYPVRVRIQREDRDSIEALQALAIPLPSGETVPLGQLARFDYVRGPQMIRSEDTFVTSYVLFDRDPALPEVEVVERAQRALEERLRDGRLNLPDGVSYEFAGTYQNQLRSERSLRVLVPVALALVFVLLHLQFRNLATSLILFSSLVVAAAGGMVGLWLYAQPWFLDVAILGRSMREVFQVGPVHLSVAVWIGFIALVGIATDDGVVVSTYLRQVFDRSPPRTAGDVRALVEEAATRRVRPCLMTTATTLLALLPVVSSTGRGSDLMMPLALPILGGMLFELLTLFVVPVLTCAWEEARLRRGSPA